MNRSESPSTALRAPSPPLGEKDGMRGYGSWKASFRFCARIGTMNRCASQRRGPDRASATRSGQDNSVLHLQQAIVPVETRFMESPLSFFACIGTMNQIGTPLPARRGEGGRRPGEGWFMERTPRTLCAPCSLEPASGPLPPSLSPLRGGRGCPKGG